MTMYGRAVSVYEKSPGSTVDVALVGDNVTTTVTVESTNDFNEVGGSFVHIESGTTLAYTTLDEDLSTLTLAAGLPTGITLAVGDTLAVSPITSALYADVLLDDVDTENALPMRINQSIRALLTPGTRDGTADGEVLAIDQPSPGQYVVVDVVGDDPTLNVPLGPGAVTQADISSDGIPPGSVTNLVTVPGKGFILVKWSPVQLNASGGTQVDLVHYNVYADTSPSVTIDSAHQVGDTYGSMMLVRELGDGTDFIYEDPNTGATETYYFAVVAQDDDGVGAAATTSGSMSKIASDDIVTGAITAGMLESVLVLGTTITTRGQDVSGNLIGPGFTLSPDALVAYDASGSATLELRPNASPSAVFRGDAEIDNLTVSTLTTLVSSQLAQGSTFTLLASVANPTQAPTATGNTYSTMTQFTADGLWANRVGITRDASGNIWTARNVGSSKGYYAEMWAPGGTKTTSRQVTTISDVYASVYIPDATNPGLLTLDYVATSQSWYVNSKADTGATTTYAVTGLQNMGTGQGHIPGVGYDAATGEVIFAQSQNTGFIKIFRKSYNSIRTGDANLGAAVITSTTAHPINIGQVLYGSFDFGVSRYVILPSTTNPTTLVLNGAADDNNYIWPVSPQGSTLSVGLTWDSVNNVFRNMSSSGKLHAYHGGSTAFSGTSATKTIYAAYTWTNGATESLISSPTSFTQNRRARIVVTTSSYPAGVTGANVYLSTASPSKTTASTTLQGATSGSPPSRVMTNPAYTPLNNPVVSGFGSGTPAQITFGAGNLQGDGSWTLPGLGSHVVGGTTTATLYDSGWQELTAFSGYTKVYAQWRRMGSLVELRFSVTNNSAISYATNGNVTGDPAILAALPSQLWPTNTVYIPTSMSARLGLTYVSTTDGMVHIAAVDGYGTASTLAVGSAINGLMSWYI